MEVGGGNSSVPLLHPTHALLTKRLVAVTQHANKRPHSLLPHSGLRLLLRRARHKHGNIVPEDTDKHHNGRDGDEDPVANRRIQVEVLPNVSFSYIRGQTYSLTADRADMVAGSPVGDVMRSSSSWMEIR